MQATTYPSAVWSRARSYTQIVRWITVATVSMLAVVLVGLVYLHERPLRGSPECGGGFACPAIPYVDAAASEDCRAFGARARGLGTDIDPRYVAAAYAWRSRGGDLGAYWGCLDGLGISWKPGDRAEPPNWNLVGFQILGNRPPPR